MTERAILEAVARADLIVRAALRIAPLVAVIVTPLTVLVWSIIERR